MSFVGGPVESINIAGRTFAVAGDADVNVKLGGSENDVQPNGNGTGRVLKTRIPSSITGLTVAIDPDNGDHEFLQAVADGTDEVPTTITYADGTPYSGAMIITGELSYSTANAVASFDMMGSGKLVKQ